MGSGVFVGAERMRSRRLTRNSRNARGGLTCRWRNGYGIGVATVGVAAAVWTGSNVGTGTVAVGSLGSVTATVGSNVATINSVDVAVTDWNDDICRCLDAGLDCRAGACSRRGRQWQDWRDGGV